MKTTPEIIDEMIQPQYLTFDEMLRRDPKTLPDDEMLQGIRAARQDRALWIKGQETKRMKREGLPETEETDDDEV